MLPHPHGARSRVSHQPTHPQSAEPSLGSAALAALPHTGMSRNLLVKLRALVRQRRRKALRSCRLHLVQRLGACEQHLGRLP